MRRITGTASIVAEIRAAIASGDLSGAERLFRNYCDKHGVTAEALEGLSWIARGCYAAKRFAKAADYARTVHRSAVRRLTATGLNSEPALESALGAAIEVLVQTKDRQGRRSEAVRFLKRELAEYGLTSVGTRIRKNLNLLTLEGEPAPDLETLEWLGPKPSSLSKLRGRPILLFFWAHYCEDSRAQAPALLRIREKFESSGVALIGPTRRYGYLDEHRRKPATRSQERRHIEAVLNRHYFGLSGMPVPIGESNFYVYGASTTPTLVLIDHSGLVSRYHPGKMVYRELAGRIQKLLS